MYMCEFTSGSNQLQTGKRIHIVDWTCIANLRYPAEQSISLYISSLVKDLEYDNMLVLLVIKYGNEPVHFPLSVAISGT